VTRLYVAAGGGGDAIAAAIVHRAGGHEEPAVIATYAWDRLGVDPLPGPRSTTDFDQLRPIGHHNHTITPATTPRPPSGSTLPRLAGDLDDTLMLLDPAAGAVGVRAQLAELAAVYSAEAVTVVDVGGDAVARGDEPGLRSPLADALVLAACVGLDLAVVVVVVGPGLDGELTERQVLDNIDGSRPARSLTADDIVPFQATLDWHPSEATALLAAAACGIRGRVEIRDAGLAVGLTDNSATTHLLDLDAVTHVNQLALALTDTVTLAEAEQVTRDVCGMSEIDFERAKARHRTTAASALRDLDAAIRTFEHEAIARGVDYVTFRRVAEALRPAAIDVNDLRDHLIATRPEHYDWPLWSLTAMTANAAR
jgi:hypothetical protein